MPFDAFNTNASDGDSMVPDGYDDQAMEAVQADVYMISGCQDKQTSADVGNVASFGVDNGPGGAGGACTNALLRTEYAPGDCTWVDLLGRMREYLAGRGYQQVPQLSTSRRLDLNQLFEIGGAYGGSRKSLLIGINYVGHSGGVLSGCINDVCSMKTFITQYEGFGDDDYSMRVLLDDHNDPNAQEYFPNCQLGYPNRDDILEGFRWLVGGAQPGDVLFVHYSGHGGQQRDTSGDEEDGKDETLCPYDYQQNGCITDDDVFQQLVAPLPVGVRLVCVMDCCHSGTVLDLPFQFTASENNMYQIEQGQPAQTFANPGFSGQMKKFLKMGMPHIQQHCPAAAGIMGMAQKFGLF